MVDVETHARSLSPITIKIEFDVVPIRMQDFQTTKRLLIGSLVLLICDKTLICASISARDEESLRNGYIYIIPIVPFHQMYITVFTLLQVRRFQMFECCIYFEAYQHMSRKISPAVPKYVSVLFEACQRMLRGMSTLILTYGAL